MARPGQIITRTISRKLVETASEWTGVELSERGTGELVESVQDENRKLRRTLDFVGFRLFNFSQGQSWELRPQARRLTAQKALVAFVEDPMAGHQVSLYISFVFGRGVPKPQAHDPEVQNALDEIGDDPANKRILTTFEKLIEKGIDFNIQSNVFFLVFDDGQDGMVRLSLLRFADVDDVVRHPKDRFRILYYKATEQEYGYDYTQGRYTVATGPNSGPKIVYYESIDAFDPDDPVQAVQDTAIQPPPANMLRRGKVLHLATNKTSEMAFGVPTMRRLLRWYSAWNKVLESHVDRMAAMASIYMKATEKGAGPRELQRLAVMATNRPNRLDAPVIDEDGGGVTGAPSGPGMLAQNESLNYEPFKIDSGAGDVSQSAPQLRAQFAAGGGFANPGYFGSEGGALAGAQAIELPILKFIEREQELWASMFRRFYERGIERRVELGMISEWRAMTPSEEEALAFAEAQNEPPPFEVNEAGEIKRDLSFEITLPSPLKRAMADLVSAAVQTATAVDPNATNPELSRWLFGFLLAEAFDVEDPQRIVDQVLPRHVAAAAAAGEVQIDPQTGEPIPTDQAPPGTEPGAVGPDGQRHPPEKPYGGRTQSPTPESRQVTETAHGGRRRRSSVVRRRQRAVEDAFDEDVMQVAERHVAALGAVSTNGNGAH